MKIARVAVVSLASVLISLTALQAAPVESVESAAANPAWQKIDSYLGEQAVAAQLLKLGVTPDQIQARLTKLDDAQLAQMSSQISKIKAGGEIESAYNNLLGPIGCVINQMAVTIRHIVKTLFCWTDLD